MARFLAWISSSNGGGSGGSSSASNSSDQPNTSTSSFRFRSSKEPTTSATTTNSPHRNAKKSKITSSAAAPAGPPSPRNRSLSRDAAAVGYADGLDTLAAAKDLSSCSSVGGTLPDHTNNNVTSSSPRRRLNSRDIPRTYSGLYGAPDDLLPFECNRQSGNLVFVNQSLIFLISTYVTLIAAVQFLSLMLVPEPAVQSWTLTNVVHLAVTMSYVHWLKGSLYDSQGEMSFMTIWEQLQASSDTLALRRLLLIVPTVLTYLACHFADYQRAYCWINIGCWAVSILAKLPFMNGVRLFGINRTVGIDDDAKYDDWEGEGDNALKGPPSARSYAGLTATKKVL